MFIKPLVRLFENWIDPYEPRGDIRPPSDVIGFVWFYIRQAKGPFVAMLILGGLVGLLEASLFWFVGQLVDIFDTLPTGAGWSELLSAHGSALFGMLAVVLVGRFMVTSLGALVEEQTVVARFFNMVRWQSYLHVSRQPLSFFQNDFAGRIVSKVLNAGQASGDLVISVLQVAWFIVIYTVSTMVLVAQLDWRLSCLVALWVVLFGFTARFFVPRVRKYARDTAEASSMLNGRVVDAFSNIQTLKLFGRSEDHDQHIRDGFARFEKAIFPFTRVLTAVRATLALLSGIMISAFGVLSIHLWLQGEVTAGGVAFTLGLVLRLNMLLGRLMTQLNAMMRNFGTIQNSAELISRPISLLDKPNATALKMTEPTIRFEHIRFHYGKGSGVIDDLSFEICAGEKIGIVGRSGAGKSTLVNLLLRFYDLEGGRITIGGQNIADVTQESLRGQIGMVMQDTALLHRSIRDNILIGRPDASEAELIDACRRAEALEFIETLKDQRGRERFDAHVGERGVKLSGGQRQRVAIARVMLKNAPILVLDEATSALDSEVEAAIQSNLYRLMEGKTVLAIAHRLSTIAALDRLIVMDKGAIVEMGTHDELLSREGLYAELWARQSGGFIAGEPAESV
ncbi:ABC transporter ATP-binding protein [Rhizobium sp. L1K21]|uniref:ABC transporter ATP-binding protein n=1 Tax=Rhizobium sp. L1K21 TaxID=2954933 RepID=UPI002093965A|nr:ABC transporter ATP-binding protein [Rhizobium sp. L1K21]MCO6185445.1 ABC transporter ATP-binding protein/permease [Rhizobium sp. L1K21]